MSLLQRFSRLQSTYAVRRGLDPGRLNRLNNTVVIAVVGGVVGTATLYLAFKQNTFKFLSTKGLNSPIAISKPENEKRKLTAREKRFIKFSSVEHNGQIYMTPLDFLESVVEGEPRPRFKRKRLTEKELQDMMYRLPRLRKNDEHFFRNLNNKGIISFSEYLFLLTILIKPQSGFKIAFAMLDQDGNKKIEKQEFKVLERVFSSAARERKKMIQENAGDDETPTPATEEKDFDDQDHGLQRMHTVDTTLLVYFFGKKGDQQLTFQDFHRFMDNLQTEVLQMEFNEFSKGVDVITEVDFARILLRYTFLNSEEYDFILDRLVHRIQEEKGITFDEFKNFCQFLNNLDDFQIAMRMYTLADKAISPEEFTRAVHICTGKQLSQHVVRTVFQIFDEDGDGMLSYQEFIAMMKDRVNRGLKTFSRQEGWTGFKRCVKQEVQAGN